MIQFASLVLEREPTQWSTLPAAAATWLQNGGVAAALAVALVLLARAIRARVSAKGVEAQIIWNLSGRLKSLAIVLQGCIIASAVGYGVLLLIWLGALFNVRGMGSVLARASDWILSISGFLALTVVIAPVLVDVATRFRWGRIWAIARLSWKEAIRGRVIWVFGSMALIFLFADWFVTAKAENQIRSYVQVVYWSMAPLFLITAGLLGSFSIPTDVLNNSIHTIVTKPVEKFEIVLGRFLGYAGLLTVGLFAISGLSLIYVIRGVNEEAKRESYRARVAEYGKLHFAGTKDAAKAQNVGREWGYRTYITGPTTKQGADFRQYAIWDFASVPSDLAKRDTPILFEFSFDIYRLSKGTEEGKGVVCTFTFADGSISAGSLPDVVGKMQQKIDAEAGVAERIHKAAMAGKFGQELVDLDKKYKDELIKIKQDAIKEFRIYQFTDDVSDQHTQEITVPASVFTSLVRTHEDAKIPALRVFVNANTADQAQMVGVARQDFYLVAAEMPFWQNFLKGVVGMWCTHMLVLGIAIACSTYLSSIISLLNTMFLFLAGLFGDYLNEIAERRIDGGGPLESSWRISTRIGFAERLSDSPTHNVIGALDGVFSWWIGRIIHLLPDVNRHDLHQYVANGFDISWIDVLFLDNALPLAGYMLPWAVLAYYLMKYREIANPQ